MVQELFRFQKCLHHLSGNRIRKNQQVLISFVFNHDLSSWGLTFPNHLNKSGFFFESIIILNFILLFDPSKNPSNFKVCGAIIGRCERDEVKPSIEMAAQLAEGSRTFVRLSRWRY